MHGGWQQVMNYEMCKRRWLKSSKNGFGLHIIITLYSDEKAMVY